MPLTVLLDGPCFWVNVNAEGPGQDALINEIHSSFVCHILRRDLIISNSQGGAIHLFTQA